MDDSMIIWKFLSREFPDIHPVIFLYCQGSVRAPQTAIERVSSITLKIFYPALSKEFIEKTIKMFLEFKKMQFGRGDIKVKPIYGP